MADDIEPADAVGDWAIVAAQLLAQLRLEPHPLDTALVGVTGTLDDAYQVTVCLARVVGQLLRPGGWDGGPIGQASASQALLRREADPVGGQPDAIAAARLVAYGAAGDSAMVRVLALAVCHAPRPVAHLRQVVRCMLEVLAAEPRIEPTPEGTPHDDHP